jgi:uncharacterized protein
MIYLDTSVLVAYYVPELLSSRAEELIISTPIIYVSELTQTEFFAALSLRLRLGDMERTDIERIGSVFSNHLADGLYGSLHLSSDVYRLARTFIARFDLPLTAPDALHLASAALDQLPIITADRQLARNAERLGLDLLLLQA